MCTMMFSAFRCIKNRNDLRSTKLKDVCSHFDIDFDEGQAHDSLYDVSKTMELWDRLID
jgi:DNA polymerase III epsilon subunit-like protein